MLDRLILEPRIGQGARWEEALTFVTYLRRMTRAVTTLAVIGTYEPGAIERIEVVAKRLQDVSAALREGAGFAVSPPSASSPVTEMDDVAEYQLRRMERQAGVLERTALELIQQ